MKITLVPLTVSAVSVFTIPGIELHKDPGMRSSAMAAQGKDL